jgi:hypothetical protein
MDPERYNGRIHQVRNDTMGDVIAAGFSDIRLALEHFTDSTETESSLRSLFYRIFLTRTGIRFA